MDDVVPDGDRAGGRFDPLPPSGKQNTGIPATHDDTARPAVPSLVTTPTGERMSKTMRKWSAAAVLAVALCGITVSGRGADDDDDPDVKALKMAIAAAGAEITKHLDKAGTSEFEALAPKIAMQHKIEATMKLMKPKSKGGISIGKLVSAGHKDSIELLIRDYAIGEWAGAKGPTKKEVTDCNADLVKAAQVTAIIAQMTPTWTPGKAQPGGKTPEKWKSLTEDMKKYSVEFLKAAKDKDEKKVGEVAKKLNNSCAECHKIFRDDK
jgi:hypothetical protein